jgi:peptidyl-prolyl cis-trans isomerase C
VKTRLFYLLGLLFLGLMAGCTGHARVSNAVAVQVNEHKLTAQELAERLARQLKNLDALAAKDPNNVSRVKNEIVRNFIVTSITSDYARANNIAVSDTDVDKELNDVRANYPDDLSFRRELAQASLSLGDWRDDVRGSLLAKKVFQKLDEKNLKPSEAEVKKYYDENKDRYRRKERIYLRQIVLDDLTKAQAVHDEVAKKKDFAELAKKYSVSPEAKQGGAVGWVEKGSVDIFDKAFALPVGGVSQVLESSYGFHIFKTERKAPAGTASLDEVRPQITQMLQAQKEQIEFMGWLDRQIRSTRVLKNTELISALSVETKGQGQ